MAITPAASPDPVKAAPSSPEGTSSEPLSHDAGIRREAAQAGSALADAPAASPRAAVVPIKSAPPVSSAPFLPGFPATLATEIDAKFATLLDEVHANRPGDDLEIIRRAWLFCLKQHEDQKRASGDPYVVHPLEVALVLAEIKMDSTAIAAGLLHDAVEDTDVTSAEIEDQFGEQVAHIVEGVTKLDKIKFANREDHQAENIRKMLLAMVTDVSVVLIKLADRLHNMRTLAPLPPEKRQKIARETLDVYAPLAHRLGMGKLRGELEDLAFRYTDAYAYNELASEVENLRGVNEGFLASIVHDIRQLLHDNNRDARVDSRIKRLYSIQQKMQTQK